jgi:hypothetical protein
MRKDAIILLLGALVSILPQVLYGAEPDTVRIHGTTYAVVTDEQMRSWGFSVPYIPREQNAAWVYLEAINAYSEPERDSKLRALRETVLQGKWTAQSAPLGRYIEENAEALALVKKAAAMPKCYFPPLGNQGDTFQDTLVSGLLIPYLSGMRELGCLLIVRGKQLESEGHPRKALDVYLLVPCVAAHVSRGPMLIHGLVGLAINRMAFAAIEQCILGAQLDEPVLAEVQARVHALAVCRPDIRWAMDNEHACSAQMVEHVLGHPEMYGGRWKWRLVLAAAGLTEDDWSRIARHDLQEYYEILERELGMPLPEYLDSDICEELSRKVTARRLPPNLMLIIGPMLPRTNYARDELGWAVLDTEFALARFRAKHNEYPEKLEDAKDLMLSDETDPFSGKPLKYRREKDGSFTLWSVGENLKDDGGEVRETEDRWFQEDIVWSSRLILSEE